MGHYENLSAPPKEALRSITFGKLKGKSDINPQWRYEALTKEYGDCGVGWKFEIVNSFTCPIPETKELMVFVQINFYTNDNGKWSDPISAFGGDFLIIKDKNGIHGNDEAYKMATTDALGTAAKMVGVAADVYRGKYEDRCDTKYNRREIDYKQADCNQGEKPQDIKRKALSQAWTNAQNIGMKTEDVALVIDYKFGAGKTSSDLTQNQACELAANIVKWFQEMTKKEE